jgi:hypothetical protein
MTDGLSDLRGHTICTTKWSDFSQIYTNFAGTHVADSGVLQLGTPLVKEELAV